MARAMKDSGIEWIGEIPENWNIKRMKSCISQRDSGAWGEEPKGTDGDTICLRIADFNYSLFKFKDTDTSQLTYRHYDKDTIKRLSLEKNDILIEKSGGGEKTPVGRTVVFDKDYTALFANFMDRLKCSSFVKPSFMQYIFATFYKNDYTRNYIKQTTGIQNLDLTSMLANEKVSVPPIEEQEKIAEFLDKKCGEIDEVIAKTEKTIEEYKALKQSVITEAVTKGIRPNRPMKDSGIEWIGQIPEEWDSSSLKRYCTFKTGSTPPTSNNEWFDGDYNWFTPSDFNDSYFLYDSIRKISLKAKEDGVATIIPNNTVLIIGIGGTAGKIGITTNECSCNQQITALLPNINVLSKYLMYWMLANAKFLKDTALYTTLPIINNQTLGEYFFLLPKDLGEQQEIADYLDAKCAEIDKLIEAKQQLLTELETYKKSVIYEYVTGKKEV